MTHKNLLKKTRVAQGVFDQSFPDKLAKETAQEEVQKAGNQLEKIMETIGTHSKKAAALEATLASVTPLEEDTLEEEEESISSQEDLPPQESTPQPDAQQEEDIEMQDIQDLPAGMPPGTDLTLEEADKHLGAVGGMTPVTPEED